jgi:hypothetical protein
LTQWEGSVTWHGGMATSVEGEATPRRGKGGDDANWADANFTSQKNEKKIHTIDLASTNGR